MVAGVLADAIADAVAGHRVVSLDGFLALRMAGVAVAHRAVRAGSRGDIGSFRAAGAAAATLVGVSFAGHVVGMATLEQLGVTAAVERLAIIGGAVLFGAVAAVQLSRARREGFVSSLRQQEAIDSLRDEVDARRELQEGLAWIAAHDDLTELLNRRAFVGLSDRSLATTAGTDERGALLVIDADHFKLVNDRYGHAAGDQVLRVIAQRCTASVRATDRLGRIGGEEFAVMLPGADHDRACSVAARICEAVRGEPVEWEGHLIPVTVSIGVSTLDRDVVSILEALPSSDRAMYQAKANGRDRVVVAEEAWSVVAAGRNTPTMA